MLFSWRRQLAKQATRYDRVGDGFTARVREINPHPKAIITQIHCMATVPNDAVLVFYDIETSNQTEIVQFGACCGEIDIFERLVKPRNPIDSISMNIHGITDQHVQNSPRFGAVFIAFLEWLQVVVGGIHIPIVLVGYNNWPSDDRIVHLELAAHGEHEIFRGRRVWSADLLRSVKAGTFLCDNSYHTVRAPNTCTCRQLGNMYHRHMQRPLEGAHGAAADAAPTRNPSR